MPGTVTAKHDEDQARPGLTTTGFAHRNSIQFLWRQRSGRGYRDVRKDVAS